MKNIFTLLFLIAISYSFGQTTMTVTLNNGTSQSFPLSDIDEITYSGGNTVIYSIGDEGPAGGRIVYDKGSFSNGWRYLEASTSESSISNASFSCYISNSENGIGTGLENTNKLLAECSTPGIAVKVCDLYSTTNNGVLYNDWFLPSIDELTAAFSSGVYFAYGSEYWSSSIGSGGVWSLHGNTGVVDTENSSFTNVIKPFRRF